ncbi:MAG: hypothetical protein JJU02_05550 [Cryomorphaceae bacterium]|nr:hypothetical protein [Cryomorphaceae bacterium]
MKFDRALEVLSEEIKSLDEKGLSKLADFKTDVYNAIVERVNRDEMNALKWREMYENEKIAREKLVCIVAIHGVDPYQIEMYIHQSVQKLEVLARECSTPTLIVTGKPVYCHRVPFWVKHNLRLWNEHMANPEASVDPNFENLKKLVKQNGIKKN